MNAQANVNPQAANPWVVQEAKPKQPPVPVGFYTGVFAGVTEVTLPSGEIRWRFAWEVKTGPEAGKVASALTNRTINPNTLAGRLIEGLLGQPLKAGDDVKALVDACVGQTYLVSVQPGPKGGKPGVKSVGKPPAM